MADGEQDPEQKTEDPTQKKLDDAQKKGRLVTSREVSSFLLLLSLTIFITSMMPGLMLDAHDLLLPLVEKADLLSMDVYSMADLGRRVIFGMMQIMLVPLGIALLTMLFASYLQHGNVLTVEPMKPKLNRISPLAGFKRLFSMKSLVEFLKGLVKICIVAWAISIAIRGDLGSIKTVTDRDAAAILLFILALASKVLIAVCVAMFFIAWLDYMYQRFEFMKNMRMTMQEVKDEYKQQEGDPHVKQKLRQIRMERAQNRMMAAVPDSDVVITNPTHYAIALKYTKGEMTAPMVVAKGIDHLALTIRTLAKEHHIEIIENPPLARTLYDDVDVDTEIPLQHYKAVAEIISTIYHMKNRQEKSWQPSE